jgi:hypothetical protein
MLEFTEKFAQFGFAAVTASGLGYVLFYVLQYLLNQNKELILSHRDLSKTFTTALEENTRAINNVLNRVSGSRND